MIAGQPQLFYKVDLPSNEPCIHQARLPQEEESSFSSLDSEIISKHYRHKYAQHGTGYHSPMLYRKYNYLEKSPEMQQRYATRSLRQYASGGNADFTLQNSKRVKERCSLKSNDDKQRRIDELLTENEVLRGQLQMLKTTNSNIQAEVRKGSEQIKRMRRQLTKNMQDVHAAHPDAEQEMRDRVTVAEAKIRQYQNDLQLATRKHEHQKQKCVRLEQQLKTLRQRLHLTQEQIHQTEVVREKGLKANETELEKSHRQLKKLETRFRQVSKAYQQQHEQYSSLLVKFRQISSKKESSKWKDNFIEVFVDMIKRLGSRDGFKIPGEISVKKQTKMAWRYLKRIIDSILKKQKT